MYSETMEFHMFCKSKEGLIVQQTQNDWMILNVICDFPWILSTHDYMYDMYVRNLNHQKPETAWQYSALCRCQTRKTETPLGPWLTALYIYTCVNYLGDICKYIYTYVNYMCVCVWNIVFMTTLCLICNVLNSVMKNVGHLCVCVINDHPPVFWVMLFAMLDLRHVHHFHLSHGRNLLLSGSASSS